jgi:hypothetical protein
LAGIGEFPATIRDRGIMVVMQRRQASQSVARFIYRIASQVAANLKEQVESWASTNNDRIRAIYETAPSAQFLSDREEENWAPLFSILSIAHPSRLSELRIDAEALSRRKAEADDEQTQALEILRHALEVWHASESTIASTELIDRLRLKEDAPTFKPSDGGRPEMELSPRRLARMIRGFGVRPINLRCDGHVRKGYRRAHLESALAPYLPSLSATAATELANEELEPDFPSATAGSVADAFLFGNPTKQSHVADVADKSGEPTPGSFSPEPPTEGDGEDVGENSLLYERAVQLATSHDEISISLLKEHLDITTPRAVQLIDLMEQKGFVSHSNGPGPRKVLKGTDPSDLAPESAPSTGATPKYQPEALPEGGWRCECGAEGNDPVEWSKHTGKSGCPLKASPSSKPSTHNFGKAQRGDRREG